MPTVHVTTQDGEKLDFDAEEGLSLMEALVNKGAPIEAICGGCLSCATCHVYIDEEQMSLFPPKSEDEEDMLELANNVQDNSRLSCQLRLENAHQGLRVTLCDE